MELHKHLIAFAQEFRKSILLLFSVIAVSTVAAYFISPAIFNILQSHLNQKLAFYTVAEPFLAHVKLAFATAIFVLMPFILFMLWNALARPFGLTRKNQIIFTLATSSLFYAGVTFCYLVTLPFGVNFLLGYGSEELQPIISIGKFVSFIGLFIISFGVIFELPVFMIFCSKSGLCPRTSFEKNRRYALLIISIVAALLTPTPDVVNMMLMGGPLYLLYEAGIIILKIMRIP